MLRIFHKFIIKIKIQINYPQLNKFSKKKMVKKTILYQILATYFPAIKLQDKTNLIKHSSKFIKICIYINKQVKIICFNKIYTQMNYICKINPF